MADNDHPDSIRNDVDSATLARVVMANTRDGDLTLLLGAIATACKLVSRSTRKAGIAGLFGTGMSLVRICALYLNPRFFVFLYVKRITN